MRIVKRFDVKKFENISKAIDEIIIRIPLKSNRIVFSLSKGEGDEICLPIVNDDDIIRGLIVHEIFHRVVKEKNIWTGIEFIDDVIANREAIKNGFGKELFNYYYLHFLKRDEINDLEEFLKLNIPWLSFHGHEYEKQFLRELVNKCKYRKLFLQKTRRLFEAMQKEMKEKDIENVVKIYRCMKCR